MRPHSSCYDDYANALLSITRRYSGPTVHFVDEHYDTGRILAQRAVPVLADDGPEQLAARVLKEVSFNLVKVAS